MSRLGIAVVGCGRRGSQWIDAVLAHHRFVLRAVVDVDRAAAEAALAVSSATGVEVAVELQQATAAGGVDAVVVATTPPQHAAVCRTALDHGCAVLVEKPFTTSLADAVELARHADGRQLALLVAQNYRFLRWVRRARRLLDDGGLGAVTSMSMRYERPWADVEPSIRTSENSVVWEMAPHHLDLVRHLLDDDVASVYADLTSGGTTLHALARTGRGVPVGYAATYRSTGLRWPEGGRRFTMRIDGTEGSLHVVQRWLLLERPRGLPRVLRRGPRPHTEEASLLTALADAVDHGATVGCARENLGTMAAVEACLVSAREDRAVDPRRLLADVTAR